MAAALLSGPGSGSAIHPGLNRKLGYTSHALGGALGGAILGAMLAAMTALGTANVGVRVATTLAICGAAIWLAVPRFRPLNGVGRQWQVPRRLPMLNPYIRQIYWGALLGVGVLTVVPNSIALLLPAAVVGTGSQKVALVAGTTYGLVRAFLAILLSNRFRAINATPGDVIGSYETLARRMSRVSGVMTPLLALFIVLALWQLVGSGW